MTGPWNPGSWAPDAWVDGAWTEGADRPPSPPPMQMYAGDESVDGWAPGSWAEGAWAPGVWRAGIDPPLDRNLYPRDILDEARDAHETFDRERTTDRVLLRRLGSLERTLFMEAVQHDVDGLTMTSEAKEQVLQRAMMRGRGIEMPAMYSLRSIFAVAEDERLVRVQQVPKDQQLDQIHRFPAAYVRGNRIFPVDLRAAGGGSHGWEEFASLRIDYVPVPDAPKMDERMFLPDGARDALVRGLELFLATRMRVLREMPMLPEEFQLAREGFVGSLREREGAEAWIVRRV